MKIALRALVALTAVISVGCGSKPPPAKELPAPPVITEFAVSKTRIEKGESVTITFASENASEAVLLDGTGTEVSFEGSPQSGTATVTPAETSVYVLKVKGEGGRDSAFVRVAVGEDLEDVFLAAVPPEVEAGEPVTLLWSAFNAKQATITSPTGESFELELGNGAGSFEVTPVRSGTFTLSATGVDPQAPLTAEAQVQVIAQVGSFTASSYSADVGETLTLSWETEGANEVVLSEAVLGELKRVSTPGETAEVDSGTFEFEVPSTLPSGAAVIDGQPFRFTLQVTQETPALTVSRELTTYVGEGAVIEAFFAPTAVTAGKTVPVSWRTANASQVQLFVNGLLVFETLPSDPARAANGQYVLAPIGTDLVVELVAKGHTGVTAKQQRTVAIVQAPVIDSFDLPMNVSNAGDSATATWTTTNAAHVVIRPRQGPSVFSTSNPMAVASGSASVYPSSQTVFVLEAFNAAGDKVAAEKTINVSVPAQVSAAPSPALAGSQIDINWALDVNTTTDVIGIPNSVPVKDAAIPQWLELDGHVQAETLVFDQNNDAISRLPLAIPFRFSMVDGVREAFYVSTNGFLAFEDVGALPTNGDLTAAGPEVLAPFWDDLLLADGEVLYVVDGQSFPRRLVIQWNKVKSAVDPAGELTFQLQLEETGQFRFLYKTLTGADSAGENATIGVRLRNGEFDATLGFDAGATVVAAGDQFTWFGGGSISGTLALTAFSTNFYGFFSRLQGGKYMFHSLPVWVFAPGSLQVTETMPVPGSGVQAGQWVELYNAQSVPVDIGGLELTTPTAAQPFVLPPTLVPAKSFVVFGESTDTQMNGGAPVDHVWSGIALAPGDLVQVSLQGSTLSSLEWTTALQGESVQAPEKAIDATGAPVSCQRVKMFGGAYIGTPGEANETCFEYSFVSIPGAYDDLTGDGVELIASTSTSTGYGTVDLPVPFTYFGQTFTQVSVSRAGFISFGDPLTDAYAEPNDTMPGGAMSTPNGTIAPFWERLVQNTAGELRMARRADHTVISWQDYRVFSAGSTGSRLYFQVKLFDDGAIEFHYGAMGQSTFSSYLTHHTGTSATTWIERLDGSGALPINIDTAGGISANSGYRFTPNP